MESILKKRSAPHLFLLFVFAIFSAASYFRIFEIYELGSLDARFLLRIHKVHPSDKIAIIEIGEDTIKKLGRFPFDRRYHAIAVKALGEFGAKTVIFDLLFSEPHVDDRELVEAIAAADNIYLPYAFDIGKSRGGRVIEAGGYLANIAQDLAGRAKGTGHINLIPDIDGKFRRVPLFIKYENAAYPYLSLKAACDHLGIPDKDIRIEPGRYIALGKEIKVPLDDRSNMIVNFSGRWGASYSHYSFVDLLQSYAAHITGARPVIDPRSLKGRICVIGLTAAGTSDIHPSPFEALYPGVGIHAETINSVLNRRFIGRVSKGPNILMLLVACMVIVFLTLKARPLAGLFMLMAAVFIFSLLAILLFSLAGLWIDYICPIFAMGTVYLSCTLYKYIGEWKKRLILENELDIAKKIQESFLPKSVPDLAGLDISASMLTARQVGGDLYDFMKFEDGRLGVMVGDVSGKGIPASLFMAMTAGAFKFFAGPDSAPRDVLAGLNEKLVKESSSGLFVTVFYAVFDLKRNILAYASGGHLPALFLRRGGPVAFLDSDEGAPLGLLEGGYSQSEAAIANGDTIVFYTDGVTEAMNSKREMYGRDRLASVVRNNAHLPSLRILEAIEKDLRAFEPKDSQHDDITVIVVKIR